MASAISIHIPRVGDDSLTLGPDYERKMISIHIPRVGDDGGAAVRLGGIDISIHIPRVGDDGGMASEAQTR